MHSLHYTQARLEPRRVFPAGQQGPQPLRASVSLTFISFASHLLFASGTDPGTTSTFFQQLLREYSCAASIRPFSQPTTPVEQRGCAPVDQDAAPPFPGSHYGFHRALPRLRLQGGNGVVKHALVAGLGPLRSCKWFTAPWFICCLGVFLCCLRVLLCRAGGALQQTLQVRMGAEAAGGSLYCWGCAGTERGVGPFCCCSGLC